jgi:hypothetical protein
VYYTANSIKVEQEQDKQDQREERYAYRFGRVTKSIKASTKARVFLYFNTPSAAMKANLTATKGNLTATKGNLTATKGSLTATKPNKILLTQGFDLTSFPLFSA